jgi:hypothetical protein
MFGRASGSGTGFVAAASIVGACATVAGGCAAVVAAFFVPSV